MPTNRRGRIILPLSPSKRSLLLKKTFLELEGTHTERYNELRRITGLSIEAIYKQSKRHNWIQLLTEQNENVEQMQLIDNSVTKMLPDVPTDVSFSAIQGNIKDFSYLMVHTTKHVCEVASRMIVYYSGRMTQLMNSVEGNFDNLTTVQTMKMEMYEDKIAKYQRMIMEYIKPNAVAKYLEMIGFQEAVGAVPDGMELGLLTPQKLLASIAKVGFNNIVGNLEIGEEMRAQIMEEGIELPEIDARKVQDLVNRINMTVDTHAEVQITTVQKTRINLEGI